MSIIAILTTLVHNTLTCKQLLLWIGGRNQSSHNLKLSIFFLMRQNNGTPITPRYGLHFV